MENTELTAMADGQEGGAVLPGPFTPARALDCFSQDILDPRKVRQIVLQKFHGEVMRCPACGQPVSERQHETLIQENGRVCCKHCKRWFTNRTGTILDRSCLTFNSFYLLAVLSALKVEPQQIAQILDIHPDTAKNWQAKFRVMEEVIDG